MKIEVQWFESGKYPQFNVSLFTKGGEEAFLVIRGCRIADGKNGEFVGWPATKNKDGRYWNHVMGSEKFNQAVLETARKVRPSGKQDEPDFDDDIPF